MNAGRWRRGSNQYKKWAAAGSARTGTRAVYATVQDPDYAEDRPFPGDGPDDEETLRRTVAARMSTVISALPRPGAAVEQVPAAMVDSLIAAAEHIADLVRSLPVSSEPETDEEDVAWVFDHPDEAAAGFGRRTVHELDSVWGGDIAKARFAHQHGLRTPFEVVTIRSGRDVKYDVIEPEWFNHGFCSQAVIANWKHKGFTADDAAVWISLNLGAQQAAMWRDKGFGTDTAAEWVARFNDPAEAAEWRDAGFTAQESGDWIAQGHTLASAVRERRKGHDATDVVRLGPGGIVGRSWQNVADKVTEAGFVVSDPAPGGRGRGAGWTVEVTDPYTGEHVAEITYSDKGRFKEARAGSDIRRTRRGGYQFPSVRTVRELPVVLTKWQTASRIR